MWLGQPELAQLLAIIAQVQSLFIAVQPHKSHLLSNLSTEGRRQEQAGQLRVRPIGAVRRGIQAPHEAGIFLCYRLQHKEGSPLRVQHQEETSIILQLSQAGWASHQEGQSHRNRCRRSWWAVEQGGGGGFGAGVGEKALGHRRAPMRSGVRGVVFVNL